MDKYKPETVANSVANELIRKIQDKSVRIGVIGLGYVGLPLAVDKAIAGYEVIGFDIQQRRVDMVNQGVNYIGDVVDEELREVVRTGKLRATTDYDEIKNLDIVTICVPTPLDKNKQPDLTYIRNSAQEVAKRLHAGMIKTKATKNTIFTVLFFATFTQSPQTSRLLTLSYHSTSEFYYELRRFLILFMACFVKSCMFSSFSTNNPAK